MKKTVIRKLTLFTLLLLNIAAVAQQGETDTTKAVIFSVKDLAKQPLDSNTLIVINGRVTGTIRELVAILLDTTNILTVYEI